MFMKTTIINNRIISNFFILIFFLNYTNINSQEDKKPLSISLSYYKIADGASNIKVSMNFKGDEGWEVAKNVPFEIVSISETETFLAKGSVDSHGESGIMLPKGFVKNDNQIELRVVNHPIYEDTTESIYFKDVNLTSKLIVGEDGKQISARLVDVEGNPIADEGLKVQVKRMFKGLSIGEGTYYTDENGEILVSIEEEYKSFDGNLIFEVVLDEHSDFGTVTAQMSADFGIAGTDLSTFDKRRLWSPVSKTPLFYLIVPNFVLLTILGVFIYLIRSLFKISKS